VKDDTIVALNILEVDVLIHILDEIVSEHKIPEVITEEIREELFAELDIAKILNDLKEKLGKEKFEQLQDLVEEEQNEVRTFAIKFSDNDIDYLRNGDYGEVEIVVTHILQQIKEQEE
jgi:hypothetical protein